jgi:hypothetical protein
MKIEHEEKPLVVTLETDAEIQAFMNLIFKSKPVYAEEKSMQLRILKWHMGRGK